jgi:hypothetical protein
MDAEDAPQGDDSSGAVAAPPPPPSRFDMSALPDAARDALFSNLSRETAAVACCVCRAWNRALATTARHLWADLDFQTPFFSRRPISDAVVRGACAKARDALRSLATAGRRGRGAAAA